MRGVTGNCDVLDKHGKIQKNFVLPDSLLAFSHAKSVKILQLREESTQRVKYFMRYHQPDAQTALHR
jgi:hypothetical protein